LSPYLVGMIIGGIIILFDRKYANKLLSDAGLSVAGMGASSSASSAAVSGCGSCSGTTTAPATGLDPRPLGPPAVAGAPSAPKTAYLNPASLHVDPGTGLYAAAGVSSALGNLTTPPGFVINPQTGLLVPNANSGGF
jgi:hypothetical protein